MTQLPMAYVVAARPNFMKISPIIRELQKRSAPYVLIHTGQHYDKNMSKIFFDELQMPKPDVNLGIGSASHAQQTAHVMMAFEQWLLKNEIQAIMVAGDVNSTMACSIAASKLHIPVIHLEAGLRSFDRRMPEEINRIVTDAISDVLLTPSRDADENLKNEGIAPHKISLVGNIMIDSLQHYLPIANERTIQTQLGIESGAYALITLHRPSNVDQPETLLPLMQAFNKLASSIPLIFSVHPRTRTHIKRLANFSLHPNITLLEPLGYLDFLKLEADAKFVLTDSGGIQEETTVLGIPCLTIRENTERPITCSQGTNTLIGSDTEKLMAYSEKIIAGTYKQGDIPELWDGQTAARVVDEIEHRFY